MNPKNRSSKDSVLSGYAIWGFCFLIAAMVSGCLGTYGKLNWDPQVTTIGLLPSPEFLAIMLWNQGCGGKCSRIPKNLKV
jgi:hypothetical protein